ncbi:nucleotidyltransferase domain-containing protein [Micromonospora eburnea]|uniref:Nucleotidyltransferase domain-containing protein n=1 Tax=Micromonospora eburnea TaxID=227316 RepID=A0A1C6UWE4_9ACTN|nr:nucleotidyltransferase domain-containing protein [Micromonospora eburnea]SCL58392.1 Nucleotidyltransferase domain-containing protein [Micromonospora eburnea]
MAVLPAAAQALVTRYLDEVDAVLPGFVEGLYVVGSAALGAWQIGVSDIDTLIVTARPAGAEDLAALAEIHAGMPAGPYLDGVYLDRDTFAARPIDRLTVPFVVNGQFHTDRPCGELHPVVWLILQRYGLPVRGPAVADLGLQVDPDALRRFNLDNLRTYWAPLADRLRAALHGLPDDEPVEATECRGEGVVWCVLGPARLHFTLANDDVIPKAGAGVYLAGIAPSYGPLAERAVRWRQGKPVAFTVADARAAADSIDAVVADAVRRWG